MLSSASPSSNGTTTWLSLCTLHQRPNVKCKRTSSSTSQRHTSHTSKLQPLLRQHQVEAPQIPPSFPSSQPFLKENRPQVASTQEMNNHSMVSATSVEAKDTSRPHVGTRKFCSSMTTAMKNT